MHLAESLIALGGAFLAAGLLARVGRRVGLPTIPLFVIAGIMFGPNTPGVVLVEDPEELALIASLGLIFLLFYLGLEFSLDQLTAGGKPLLASAAAYLVLNIGAGLAFGFALGWGTAEALVIAGIVGISSSAIVTKLLVELGRLDNPETRVILGIIVVEDLFLAAYLALLQPVLGGASDATEAATEMAIAFAFLLVLALIARHGSRAVNRLLHTDDEEIVTVLFVGLAIVVAGIAAELGVSDAIGAFMIGTIIAASAKGALVRRLTHPLRDAFGAIFFFHFGLTIDPSAVVDVLPLVVIAVVMTAAVAVVAGVIAARFNKLGRTEAGNIAMTVFTRGEFSLVLATLAVAAGLDERLAAFTAGYVLILAVVGPLSVTMSPLVGPRLPRRLFGRSSRSEVGAS